MDAYYYHRKFEKEIKRDVDQGHYLNAFTEELQAELTRLKNSGQIKRITSKVESEVSETIYKRMLEWYKADYNPLFKGNSPLNFKQSLYNVVSGTRYAAVWCYTLGFLHSTKE